MIKDKKIIYKGSVDSGAIPARERVTEDETIPILEVLKVVGSCSFI